METVIKIALAASMFLGLWSLWQSFALRRRFTAALGTDSGRSLEATLAAYLKKVEVVERDLAKLTESHNRLKVMAALASQKISVVRFNPFGDTGGDQSFVLAVLDAHDSGYVITSIHGREGTRVYVKPVDYGKSKYTLSKEEQQALEQASRRVPKE